MRDLEHEQRKSTAVGIRELTELETSQVSGAVGLPGAVIGGVIGSFGGAIGYVVTHSASSGRGADASVGGFLAATFGGGAVGALSGATGGYIAQGIGAVGSIIVGGLSTTIDAQQTAH